MLPSWTMKALSGTRHCFPSRLLAMRIPTRFGLCLVAALCAACSQPQENGSPSQPRSGEWFPLFNGEDLDGWTPKIRGHALGEDPYDTFLVEDGLLRVSYDGYESFDRRFGHLFFETPFSHYRLRSEYRFVGDQVEGGPGWAFRNNGFMLHGQDPASMSVEQEFPASIEAQILGGGAEGERSTGNLCTPGTNVEMEGELVTRHCTNSTSSTQRGDGWVVFEVEVRGSESIRHFINGELVLEYQAPQLDPNNEDAQRLLAAGAETLLEAGTISIQAESHPTDFRSIEIMLLD